MALNAQNISGKKVGIVICNYNKAEYVVNCIQSVLESSMDDFDIYVIDNASSDDSAKRITEKFKERVTLIVNPENLGGSGGFNTGIRIVMNGGYKYVWCLDNDVLVDENALKVLVDFLDSHPESGMAGSRVVHMDNPEYIQQYGMTVNFKDYCVSANYLNEYNDDKLIPPVVYSDAVAACSVLVRTDVIAKIGMLPEENFLYWDDTEWGIRCNNAGYKVASVGASLVEHEMGAKKEAVNTFATYYAWRNEILFFLQHEPYDRLDDMAHTFIHAVFDIVYEGLYNGEHNKTKTVMFAYDDALHGITGKADDSKIFDLDKGENIRLNALAKSSDTFEIKVNGFEALACETAEKIKKINPSCSFYIDGLSGNIPPETADLFESGADSTNKANRNTSNVKKISLCENIFHVDDTSLRSSYIDVNGNVFSSEDDAMMIINYNYSFRTFYESQKDLFLSFAKKIRK